MAAYTQAELITRFTQASGGIAPNAAQQQLLAGWANSNATNGLTDQQTLQLTANLAADTTTAVSVGAYQFFTGAAPSGAGLVALSAAYAPTGAQANLNGENRFIAQSVSLATQNAAAKTAFTAAYGALSVAAATSQAYGVIIGSAAAAAAGVDVNAAVAFLSSAASVTYYTNFIKANTALTATADIDLAVKAAIIGEILYIATSYNNGAGIGSYAVATNNLVLDLADADGKLVADNAAGFNLFTAYPGGATQGQTFNLVYGQDSLTGTNANDTFIAGIVNTSGFLGLQSSLQSVDIIDGGSGTDRINITLDGTVGNAAPTLKSIEQVSLRFANNDSIDLANATGVTDIIVDSSAQSGEIYNAGTAALTVSNQTQDVYFEGNAATTSTITVSNTTGVYINVGDGATNLGTALTLNLNNAAFVDLDGAAYTSAKITATGASELDLNNTASTLTAVTVAGAGDLDLWNNNDLSALVTFDGSAGTGKQTLYSTSTAIKTVTTGAGADLVEIGGVLSATAVISLGDGADSLVLDVAPTAGAKFDGGAGVDSIGFTDAIYTAVAAFTAPQKALFTNFETLLISDAAALGGTYDLTTLSGITNFTLGDGVTTAMTTTVNNFASGATLTLNGDLTTNNGVVAVVFKDATGAADSLNIVATGNDDTATNQANVTAAGVETVKFTATSTDTTPTAVYTLALTDTALKSLTIAGNEKVAYTAVGTVALTTVDASANTAGVTLNTSAINTKVTITGTTKADTFTLHDNAVVTGNGGNDTFILTASTNGQSYATITDANKGDKLSFGDLGVETFVSTKIGLADTAVFQDFLDAATAGNGSVNGAIGWFQYQGNTYVVEDRSAASTFQNGADAIVKLAGLIDLSTATGAGTNVITLG